MSEISENTKFNFSLQFMVLLIGGIVSVSTVYLTGQLTNQRSIDNEHQIEKNQETDRFEREKIRAEESEKHKEIYRWFKDYVDSELGGLRSDMDKEDKELLERIKKLER